jgi:hypothetical protein
VYQGVVQAEEVGEPHHDHAPEKQHYPQEGGQALLGVHEPVPPCVVQVVDTLERLEVECPPGVRANFRESNLYALGWIAA